MDFTDTIKNHFAKGDWKTDLMYNLTVNYDFRMTYTGTYKAQTLKTEDKNIKGFIHNFETIGFDRSIVPIEYMTIETQTANGNIVEPTDVLQGIDYIFANEEVIVG